MPLFVAPPVTQSLSEVIPCLADQDGWIQTAREAVRETQDVPAAQQEPKWRARPAKILFAETIHCHPLGAPPGLRGYSKEPQTCPTALN